MSGADVWPDLVAEPAGRDPVGVKAHLSGKDHGVRRSLEPRPEAKEVDRVVQDLDLCIRLQLKQPGGVPARGDQYPGHRRDGRRLEPGKAARLMLKDSPASEPLIGRRLGEQVRDTVDRIE